MGIETLFGAGSGGGGGGAAVLAAGGDLASTALQYNLNKRSQKRQQRFQQRMSNTAYQRAADDLEAAGINRIIAVGNPASSPSGASASVSAPDLGGAVETGIHAATAKQQIAQSKAQESYLGSQERLSDQQKIVAEEQARLTAANADEAEFKKMFYDKFGPQAERIMDYVIERFGMGPGNESAIDRFLDSLLGSNKPTGDRSASGRPPRARTRTPSKKRVDEDAGIGNGGNNLPPRRRTR